MHMRCDAPLSPARVVLAMAHMRNRRACNLVSYDQDYFIPLALDERWPDDTLFLCFEEDFRFDPPPPPTVRPRGSVAQELHARAAADRSLQPSATAAHSQPDRRLKQADQHVFVRRWRVL